MSIKLNSVKWKTASCGDPACWCLMIVPVENVTDDQGNEWDYVIGAGELNSELAAYIVELHNEHLEEREAYAPNDALVNGMQNYLERVNLQLDQYELLADKLPEPTPCDNLVDYRAQIDDRVNKLGEMIKEEDKSNVVDVPQGVWDRMRKMEEERKANGEPPCCDENNPCACATFSPTMAGPGDWEREMRIKNPETKNSMVQAAREELNIQPEESIFRKIWQRMGMK